MPTNVPLCPSLLLYIGGGGGGGESPTTPERTHEIQGSGVQYNGDTVLEKVVTTYVVVNGQNLVTFLQLSVFTFSHSQYHY